MLALKEGVNRHGGSACKTLIRARKSACASKTAPAYSPLDPSNVSHLETRRLLQLRLQRFARRSLDHGGICRARLCTQSANMGREGHSFVSEGRKLMPCTCHRLRATSMRCDILGDSPRQDCMPQGGLPMPLHTYVDNTATLHTTHMSGRYFFHNALVKAGVTSKHTYIT